MPDTRTLESPQLDHARAPDPFAADGAQPPEPPKSAARLAAELAFSMPPRPPQPDNPPAVVVRKRRGVADAADADAVGPAAPAPVSARGPRIFRVAEAGATGTAPSPLQRDPVAARRDGEQLPRRKRRIAAEQRPGPVVQVFQAPAPPPAAPGGLSPVQLAQLAARLARIETVFDDIRRAQAFRFSA